MVDLGDGTDWQEPVLHFRNLTNADWVLLRDFVQDTVQFAKTLFTYTDPFGTAHTNMRYLGGIEAFVAGPGRRWSGDLRIALDKSA